MIKKTIILSVLVSLVVNLLVVLVILGNTEGSKLGSFIETVKITFGKGFVSEEASEFSSTLAVTGATTLSSTLSVTGNTAVDTNGLFVNATSNRVGVGTTTPQGRLHIEDNPAGDGTIASTTVFVGQVGTTTSRSQFQMKQADGGTSCVYPNVAGTALVVQDGACN